MTKNLLLLSTSYWDGPLKFRRHHFAKLALQSGYNVIYVNPIFTFLSWIQEKDCRAIFFDYFKSKKTNGVNVLTLPPLLPFQQKFHFIRLINIRISRFFILRYISKVFIQEPFIQIVYIPEDFYRLFPTKENILVYDCVDDHSQYPWNVKVRKKILTLEKQLIEKVDLLSCSSPFLLNNKKHLNSNNVLATNGVDYKYFSDFIHNEVAEPVGLKKIGHPRILYVGAVMEWFDYELIKDICHQKPEWNLVLIGPTCANTDESIFKLENVHYLGVKPQPELPLYIKFCDLCIIPFKINDLVKSVNPLKLYEYLSLGKAVVSTKLPDVAKLSDSYNILIGESNEDFIKKVDTLLKIWDVNVKSRLLIAEQFSWDRIFRTLFDRIVQTEKKKSSI